MTVYAAEFVYSELDKEKKWHLKSEVRIFDTEKEAIEVLDGYEGWCKRNPSFLKWRLSKVIQIDKVIE